MNEQLSFDSCYSTLIRHNVTHDPATRHTHARNTHAHHLNPYNRRSHCFEKFPKWKWCCWCCCQNSVDDGGSGSGGGASASSFLLLVLVDEDVNLTELKSFDICINFQLQCTNWSSFIHLFVSFASHTSTPTHIQPSCVHSYITWLWRIYRIILHTFTSMMMNITILLLFLLSSSSVV